MLLSSSYNHETLSGDCFEESSPGGGAAQQMSMQEPQMKPCVSDSGAPPRQLRIKPQPNQVLKCPRCNSLNTKFCYYNNYSLTQPRHFCKNCRRYWTKGGALRNVPVGGGCRKNKRAKQKNSDQSTASQQSDKAAAVNPHAQFEPRHHAQQLLASSSSLYDLAKEDDLGLPYGRIPHLRLGPMDSATSSGLTFEIPRPGAFNSLPLNLPPGAFEPAATLNFQGLMKHENTGEFAPIYDPSLNLLGGPGPSVSAAAPDTLGSFNINLGLENFVGLGLNGDLKWRQQQQHKVPGMIGDGDSHQHVFHLDEDRRTKGKVLSEQETGMNSGEWQQQQEQSFVEQPEAATYWSTTGTWPVDLPIYMDQQYCDVKPVDQHGVPDFYSRTAARCTPSLT